jgi:hypothetical protein
LSYGNLDLKYIYPRKVIGFCITKIKKMELAKISLAKGFDL